MALLMHVLLTVTSARKHLELVPEHASPDDPLASPAGAPSARKENLSFPPGQHQAPSQNFRHTESHI